MLSSLFIVFKYMTTCTDCDYFYFPRRKNSVKLIDSIFTRIIRCHWANITLLEEFWVFFFFPSFLLVNTDSHSS